MRLSIRGFDRLARKLQDVCGISLNIVHRDLMTATQNYQVYINFS